MNLSPLSRRAVVGRGLLGGLLGVATLSGCSISGLTTRKVIDPQAADRQRIALAHDLSEQLLTDLGPAETTNSAWASTARTLHTQQSAVFVRVAGLATKLTVPQGTTSPAATALLTPATLPDREQALAQKFRTLALAADDGDVAALLASAAAGVDQLMTKGL